VYLSKIYNKLNYFRANNATKKLYDYSHIGRRLKLSHSVVKCKRYKKYMFIMNT